MLKKLLLIFSFIIFPLQGFTLEKTLPYNTSYIGIKVHQNINALLKKSLSPTFKGLFYPPNQKESPIQNMINVLQQKKISLIEIFNNPEWGVLVRVKSSDMKALAQLFANLLKNEGLQPKINIINKNNMTISNKSDTGNSNSFYLKTSEGHVLISTKKEALSAWKQKNSSFPFYNSMQQFMNNPNLLLFSYQAIDAHNSYCLLLNTVGKSLTKLSLNILYKSSLDLTKVTAPLFIPDSPLFLLTKPLSMLNNISFLQTLPFYKTIMSILNTPQSGIDYGTIVLSKGDLFTLNSLKYDEMEAAFIFKSRNIYLLENSLKSLSLINQNINISMKTINGAHLYTFSEKKNSNMKNKPLYILISGSYFIFSMDKAYLTKISLNIKNNKKTININSKSIANLESFINFHKLLSNFPIITSLAGQFGLNLSVLSSLTAYTTTKLNSAGQGFYRQDIDVILK